MDVFELTAGSADRRAVWALLLSHSESNRAHVQHCARFLTDHIHATRHRTRDELNAPATHPKRSPVPERPAWDPRESSAALIDRVTSSTG